MTLMEWSEETGYEFKTTFWQDFTIADCFGIDAVKDTFKRAFNEWKTNHVYLTELAIVMNLKCWSWNNRDKKFMELYRAYFYEVQDYAYSNLKGEELDYYFKCTD